MVTEVEKLVLKAVLDLGNRVEKRFGSNVPRCNEGGKGYIQWWFVICEFHQETSTWYKSQSSTYILLIWFGVW